MTKIADFLPIVFISFIALISLAPFTALGTSQVRGYDSIDSANLDRHLDRLILDVYVDEKGEALLIGYIDPENLDDLPFLETSEYTYDQDAKELYALTESLTTEITTENGDCWKLELAAVSYWDDFLAVVYLPLETDLEGIIVSSAGLEYGISELDDSLMVEVWGYGVEKPSITIEYRFVPD